MRDTLIIWLIMLVLYRCIGTESDKAQRIIDEAIKAHGGHHFENQQVSFLFRNRQYSVSRAKGNYVYTRAFVDQGDSIRDVLINSGEFTRYTNGTVADVPDTMKVKYSNSVNAVLYFMQLPYLLNDPAAQKKYLGETQIKDEDYNVIKVTFTADGGGKDFEDEYMYWISKATHMVDYLAYSYHTDEGGVRFRTAYNRLERGGIVFQDYVNYEAPVGTLLYKLPRLYEEGKLHELSRIENEAIMVKRLAE